MALSAAVAVQERRVRPLAAVERAYLVFRRRPLAELSEQAQQKIRDAYEETGFVVENCYTFEEFGIYTDSSIRDDVVRAVCGQWMEVAVNDPNPNQELGLYKSFGNPNSSSQDWAERMSPGMVHLPESQVLELAQSLARAMVLASSP